MAAFSVKVLSAIVTWPEPLKIAPPLAVDRFLEKVARSTVTVPAPSFEIVAPERPPPARFSESCESLTVSVPTVSSSALLAIAPAPASVSSSPTTAAELAETVLFVTVSAPPRLLLSALPLSLAKFLVTVESRTSTTPPTWLSIPPPALPATLPVTVEESTVTVAVLLLAMAPPYSAAWPSLKVSPEKATVPPSTDTSNSRSSPCTCGGAPGGGVPPSMNVEPAPAPAIVRLSAMSRSPVVMSFWFSGGMPSSYVPPGSWISSAPGSALASWIAARSVHAPPTVPQTPSPTRASTASAVLLTAKRAGLATTTALTTSTATIVKAATAITFDDPPAIGIVVNYFQPLMRTV